MPLIFLLLLIAVPMLEIAVLIEVGSRMGVLATLALIILTAAVGMLLLRVQGMAVLARVRGQFMDNHLPTREMLEGVLLLVGGALLLTPGFVTDTVGFICLIPPTRVAIVEAVTRRCMARGFVVQRDHPGEWRQSAHRRSGDNHTIEGEYRREDD